MPFRETPLETWLCSQLAARHIVSRKRGGRIISISSIHEDVTMPTNAPYCASKGAIRMVMRTIGVELAKCGITVNDVCPGAIDTPTDAPLKRHATQYQALPVKIPLGRMGKPDAIRHVAKERLALATDGR